MENSGEKSVKKDGFEFESLESRITSSNSSNSVTFLKESCSSPAPLGWPIRKAQLMSKCSDVSEDKLKTQFDGESKIKKLGTKVSGIIYLLVSCRIFFHGI